jgi:F-type H+-transporting ATPase subunit epsilon
MPDTFHFELVSPERQLISADIAEAIIPGEEGDLAAMPAHALLITQLRPGILTIPSVHGQEMKYYLRGGFADVGPEATVVLAEYAIPLAEMTAADMADEVALGEQALEKASGDEPRRVAQTRLDRLKALQAQLAA